MCSVTFVIVPVDSALPHMADDPDLAESGFDLRSDSEEGKGEARKGNFFDDEEGRGLLRTSLTHLARQEDDSQAWSLRRGMRICDRCSARSQRLPARSVCTPPGQGKC